jgi:hypothetical protein
MSHETAGAPPIFHCGFPVVGLSGSSDVLGCEADHHGRMSTMSYGVVWREGTRPPSTGKLELLARALSLEGLAGSREIAYDSVAGVRVGRTSADRIYGRPTVVVETTSGPPLAIMAVGQPGLVGEIAERLVTLVGLLG